MKKYTDPKFEVVKFDRTDVITTSSDGEAFTEKKVMLRIDDFEEAMGGTSSGQ